MERDSTRSTRGAVLSSAAVVWLLAGCYHPGRLDCAVSCAGDTPCPSGLSCGTDLLCHGGTTECSALDASPGDSGALIDARGDAMSDAPAALAFCAPQQTGLVACFELDGNVNDAAHGHNMMLLEGPALTYKTGQVRQALSLSTTDRAQLDELAELDLATLTIEVWVNPADSTHGNNVSVVNNFFQYGLTIDVNNAPVCGYFATGAPGVPKTTRGPTAVPSNVWTHLACTYDGARMTLFVNGSAVTSSNEGGTIVTTQTQGTGIGSVPGDTTSGHFGGLLDQLRIFNVARTPAQICADAGKTSCP